MPQDPYQTLGISSNATLDDAQAAYRKRVRVLHPDRFDLVNQKVEWDLANQMLQDLNEAWNTIKNERAAYSTQEPIPPSVPPKHFHQNPDTYSVGASRTKGTVSSTSANYVSGRFPVPGRVELTSECLSFKIGFPWNLFIQDSIVLTLSTVKNVHVKIGGLYHRLTLADASGIEHRFIISAVIDWPEIWQKSMVIVKS